MPASLHDSSSDESSSSSSVDTAANGARRTLVRRSKEMASETANGKRKRAETMSGNAQTRRRTGQPSVEEDDDSSESDRYDPDQPMEERRQIQRGFRQLQKDIAENGEEYMQPGSKGLIQIMQEAQRLVEGVKQTSEATMDARLLAMAADMSYRKTKRFTQGSTDHGVDVEEFVSKCIGYMRQGAGIADDEALELSGTQRRRRRATGGAVGGDDDDENDEMLNWAHLGRFAALPQIRRPALPGFLLGPLSVEKKVRKIAKRSAPFRPNNLTETRPEVINTESLKTKENDLTAICTQILRQLKRTQTHAQETLARLFEEGKLEDDKQGELMRHHGLRSTGGIDLFRFVVNPKSFGQTVENLFYVSFLIKEGKVLIEFDEDELPSLAPVEGADVDDEGANRGKHEAAKQQAILSMDMATWQALIEAFDIKKPMIEHRRETVAGGPGSRGWYS